MTATDAQGWKSRGSAPSRGGADATDGCLKLSLQEVIGVLIAAGGPLEIDLTMPWPLHATLRSLERSKSGEDDPFPDFEFVPNPDAGEAVVGTGAALIALAEQGVVSVVTTADGHFARFSDGPGLRRYRKRLFSQPLHAAEMLYQAATSWRARSATAAKTLARARESSGAMSTDPTPNACHLPPGFVS